MFLASAAMGMVGKLRGGQGGVEREEDVESDNIIVDLGSSDSEESDEARSLCLQCTLPPAATQLLLAAATCSLQVLQCRFAGRQQ